MGFQIIQDKLQEKVTKKQFLRESGLFLIGVIIAPALLNKLLNKNRLKIVGNQIFLDDELFIDRRES